jgi:alkyl hydroperoxide reductase subunit AhpF
MKESVEFLTEELMPNKNLHENLKDYLTELEKLVVLSTFKKISKSLTEKSINKIKEKIKFHASEISKQLKKEGQQVPSYSRKDDENCLFKAAVGKYIRGLKIPIIVQ